MVRRKYQSGAVSLFIVVFTALLVTVIAVGFSQLIIRGQQQASQADLSQSAYDSALAGVEDAKRILVLNKKCQDGASVPGVNCAQITTAISSDDCNTLNKAFNTGSSAERLIQKNENDQAFNQATTCVKVNQNTPDYQGKDLSSSRSHLIPLRVAPGRSFDEVEVSWFTQDNVSTEGATPASLTVPSVGLQLLPNDESMWGVGSPPLLRAQLIQTGTSFNLTDLDKSHDSNTLFLYPDRIGATSYDFSSDPRGSGPSAVPKSAKCDPSTFSSGGYACTVGLRLPNPVGSGSSDRNAYLRLSALYNSTDYKLVLKKSGVVVDFYGVQPEVDSTGRTSDLFRRVKARVQLESSNFPYPEQAAYLYNDVCKDFFVTNRLSDYGNDRCNLDESD